MQLWFFTSPDERLYQKSPIEILRKGKFEEIVAVASAYGEQGPMIDRPGEHPYLHVELPTQRPLIFEVPTGDFFYRHHQRSTIRSTLERRATIVSMIQIIQTLTRSASSMLAQIQSAAFLNPADRRLEYQQFRERTSTIER
jgi:hypothetical protein